MPFTDRELVQAVRGLMGFNEDHETSPIFSSFNDDADMRPLLSEFTRGLVASIETLCEANARQDYETLEQVARSLKGAGSGYGFTPISEQAARVLLALNDAAADIETIKHAANKLLVVLNRVKLR